jgi:SAM-dependent methyltransferase
MEKLKSISIFIILIIITSLLGYYYKKRDEWDFDIDEHFDDFTEAQFRDNITKIYDKFYSNVWEQLFGNDMKNEFELYNITNYTIKDKKLAAFQSKDIKFLDLGCGVGKHLKILERDKYNAVGLDKSMEMLEKARLNTPNTALVKGDFMNKSIFKNREFSHILCLFFTIYYAENPDTLFKNVNYWLKPNGYFCLHMVNPKKFDPVLEKSSKLIPLYNPQKHSDTKERKTQTKLRFNKFNYTADWKFRDNNEVQFIENFMFHDNSKHRQHIHKLKMYSIKYYNDLAKKNGFKLIKIIDLLPVNHDNSYVYIFQKTYGL